jgi:hypothetical protein
MRLANFQIRRIIGAVLLAAVVMSLIVACGLASHQQTASLPASELSTYDTGAGLAVIPTQVASAPRDDIVLTGEQPALQFQPQRIILRNASLTITIADPASKVQAISQLASEMGGWVVTSNTSVVRRADGEDATSGTITIRVPAERLDEALAHIKTDADSVTGETISGHDVTNEYVDLSSRLKNLEATEQQLLRVLANAITVEDVLAVQRELSGVRENP